MEIDTEIDLDDVLDFTGFDGVTDEQRRKGEAIARALRLFVNRYRDELDPLERTVLRAYLRGSGGVMGIEFCREEIRRNLSVVRFEEALHSLREKDLLEVVMEVRGDRILRMHQAAPRMVRDLKKANIEGVV